MAETVFNEGSINGTDFRIESDDNANMFFVDSADDRIGIGTASPETIVHITGLVDDPLTSGTTSYGTMTVETNGSQLAMGSYESSPWPFYLQASTASDLSSYRNLLLNPLGGNVGIGTASPTHKLTVEGDATDGGTGNDGQLVLRGATNTNLRLMMGMDTSSEYGFISPMKLGTSWNNLSLCYNGGNVGIGDNSPATKLDVNGDIQIQGANAMILNHTTGAASDTYINSPSSDVMAFRTGGNERMRITSDGELLLKTSSLPYDFGDEKGQLVISSTDNAGANNYAVLQMQGHAINTSGIHGMVVFYDHTTENARIQSNRVGSGQGDIRFSTNAGSGNRENMRLEDGGTFNLKESAQGGLANRIRFGATTNYANGGYIDFSTGASGAIVLITNHTNDSSGLFHMDYDHDTITMIANPGGVDSDGFNNVSAGDTIRVFKSSGTFTFRVKNDTGATKAIGVAIIGCHSS